VEIKRLKQIIASLRHKLFGTSKGEVVDRGQLELALANAEGALVRLEAQEEARALRASEEAEAKTKRPVRRARFVFPEQLEEVTEVLEPEEVEAEPEAYRRIGEEVPLCAPSPARVLAGGLPSVRLLVQVILAKYVDHLPLYRQSGIFRQRYAVQLSRQTMADWIRIVAEDWLSLIYHSIKSDLQQSRFLHADETPITCNDPDSKGRSRKGYLWTYVDAEGTVLYDWQMSRSKAAAASMLGGYRGSVQCDGYGVYRSLAQEEGFTLIGCMAHVRRKFHEAFKLHGENASAWYLVQIKALYAAEKEQATGTALLEHRDEHSRPLMGALKERLEADRQELEQSRLAPKTLEAIKYALGQWEALKRYLDNAEAQIDNNRVEQAIRPTKLGAKNWLFIGHPEAGQRSAILYTLMENCKSHGIEPQAYLTDILERLPTSGSSAEAARALQPKNWKPAQAAS
jgi:transposase